MKVLVGLSGGVDSLVATKLLLDKGFDVVASTLRLLPHSSTYDNEDNKRIEKARRIAKHFNIPHVVYDFRDDFKRLVIDYFVNSYKMGETPNPCYVCNAKIKFGLMLQKALKDGFDFIATGHYATIKKNGRLGCERAHLLKAQDVNKDQSYFLSSLSREQLAHSIFPLSSLTKNEVRAIANSIGFSFDNIKESQDICFVKKGDYAGFISSLSDEKDFSKGCFIDSENRILGWHKGLQHYTIGQRRGLSLPMGCPIYVIKKDARTNSITVGKKEELICYSLIATHLNMIEDIEMGKKILVDARTRYRQIAKKAYLILEEEGSARLEFLECDEAVAKGQVVAFYQGEYCLGSGIIKETF